MTKPRKTVKPPKPPADAAPKKMGRPKQEEVRQQVPLRLFVYEVEAFKVEAEKKGLGYTAWMRMVCRRAANLDR